MKKSLCILLAVLLAFALLACDKEPESTQPPAEDTQSTAQSTQDTAVQAWMTLPEDRVLTARQYFVYCCETDQFPVTSGPEDERVYPASITKLFTAYIANQYLQPGREITVGGSLDLVYPGSSVAELSKGDTVAVRQLVEAMMLPSGNDAAYVLAVEVGRELKGSSLSAGEAANAFVSEMNRQAGLLGMTGSHFANPDGIHEDDHYSTFRDLATLGCLALEDPVLMDYTGLPVHSVSLQGGVKEWKNTNALIHPESQYYCPYAIGLKTGQTPSAGSCLLSAFEYEGQTLIIGVFGCPEVEDRFADTLQLFNQHIGYTG